MAAQPNPVAGYPPNYDAISDVTIPSGLELLQVHLFHRHGERTPVRQRLTHVGIPARWNLCSAGREFAAGVLNDPEDKHAGSTGGRKAKSSELMLLKRRFEFAQGNSPRLGEQDECSWGELTDLGRLSTLRLGGRLRELYVDKLGFLPAKISAKDADLVSLRSTALPRAFESTQQVLHGLYPMFDPSYIPTFIVRQPTEESLYPNTMCATYRNMDRASAKKAAELYNPTLLAPLDKKIADIVGVPVRIDSHPSANGILDTIKASQAHGIPVPKELADKEVLDTLEKAIVQEWFMGYADKQFTRLAMGRLLGDVSARLQERVFKPAGDRLRLALYGCHDTTLGGMLKALKCFDDRWPAFTAYISIELLKQKSGQRDRGAGSFLPAWLRRGGGQDPKDYFVRVSYNSKNLKLPACQQPGNHLEGSDGTVCTFEAFQDAMKEISMTHEEWEKACKA